MLVVKKKIIANDRPRRAGGGTVFFVSLSNCLGKRLYNSFPFILYNVLFIIIYLYLFVYYFYYFCIILQVKVSQSSHSYLKDVEYREEGGTTDVVGAVRLALAFKLKNAVGYDVISDREREISRFI